MPSKIIAKNGHIVISTIASTKHKQTALCIPQQALNNNVKLDTQQLIISKTYQCSNNRLKTAVVQRWINRLKQLPTCNPIVGYHLQRNQKGGNTLCLYQKYHKYGNLSQLIDTQWQIDCELIINLTQNVRHLHQQGVYIGTLKPENILLSRDKTQLIFTDLRLPLIHGKQQHKENFDQSEEKCNKMRWGVYSAPEIKSEGYYDEVGDIYSLGMILLELIKHDRVEGLHRKAMNNKIHSRPEDASLEYHLQRLVAKMIREDMSQRPAIQEVLEELKRINEAYKKNRKIVDCNQVVKFYMPLTHISPKFDIAEICYGEGFSRPVGNGVVEFCMDESGLYLKVKMKIGEFELMSVFVWEELDTNIQSYFQNIRQLYDHLRVNNDQMRLTATAMLSFNCSKRQTSITPSTQKQQQWKSNLPQSQLKQSQIASDTPPTRLITQQKTTP